MVEHVRAIWKARIESHAGKLMLLALADMANRDGECWPCRELLADMLEIDVRSAKRTLERLKANGWIDYSIKPGCRTVYRLTTGSKKGEENHSTDKHKVVPGPDADKHKVVPAEAQCCASHYIEGRTIKDHKEEPAESGGSSAETKRNDNEEPDMKTTPQAMLVEAWQEAYRKKFGVDYLTQKLDFIHAAKLLKTTTQDRVISVARWAWDNPNVFPCSSATSISGLLGRWNDIQAKQVQGSGRRDTAAQAKYEPDPTMINGLDPRFLKEVAK